MPFPAARQWVGLSAPESPRGTAAAPVYFVPIKSPAWDPTVNMMPDEGMRGQMVDGYDQIAGQRYDKFGFDCNVYADSFPAMVRGVLGSTDTKTGTGAPYTHTFGLLNTGTGQPPSYTLNYFDALDINQLTQAQIDSLVVKFDSGGLLTASLAYVCNAGTIITTTTNTPTAVESVASWNCVVKLAGSTITRLVDGELDFKRGAKPIPAITGTQAYYQNFAGPLSTKGSKMTVIMESDAELNYYLQNTKSIALDLSFTDPALNTVDFHMSDLLWSVGKKNPGKDWMEVDLEFWGQPNATDTAAASGGGALSPVVIAVTNSVSASY